MPRNEPFRLGEWEIHPALNELRRDGRRTRIQPRQMSLLQHLAAAPGSVLGREELLEDVWDRPMVNDEVLSRAVAVLRHALGDDAKQPRYIQTIPKRGYRLVAKPEPLSRSPWPGRRAWPFVVAAAAVLAAIPALYFVRGPDTKHLELNEGAERVLTARPGAERSPSLSPNAQRLAYLADEDGDARNELWILETATASRHRLDVVEGNITAISWSPDASRLALTVDDGRECRLGVVPVEGNGPWRSLAACSAGLASGIDWSPDGRWLIFAAPGVGSNAGLARVPTGGGPVEHLTSPEAAVTIDSDPRFDSSGSRIAFIRGDSIVREAWLLELGTTHGPHRLTNDGQFVVSLDWMSDTRLLFSSDRDGHQAIRALDLESGKTTYVGAEGARTLDWSNGNLVWEKPLYEANIWLIPKHGEARPAVASNRYDNHPVVDPSGDRLGFLSNRTGRSAIWVAGPDGRRQRLLAESRDARLTRPSWHPHGEKMLTAVFEGGKSFLAEVSMDGELTRLPGSEGAEEGHWLPSAEGIVMIAVDDQRHWLFRLGIDGTRTRLGAFVPSHAQVAQDGSVYFTKAGETGLFRLDPRGGAVETVLPDLPASSWNDWGLAGTHLAWSDGNGVHLGTIDDPGSARLVHPRPTQVVGISIGVSPDGSRLYAAYTDNVEIDLAIAEFEP